VRRRLALLVAATTSVVLLAFTLPLAVLIDRAATSAAITTATDRSQRIVPTVAAGTQDEIAVAVRSVADRDYVVRVRMPSGAVIGRPFHTPAPPVETDLRATAVRVLADGRVILDQPVVRQDGTAVISTLMSEAVLDAGVWRAWGVLGLLAVLLFVLALVVADRLARTMTRPVTELAVTAERLGRGDLSARVEPDGPDEVRDVGQALNRLAARISELLTHERESVADLSHRLRTPVTALRLDVESLPAGDGRDRLTSDVDELTRQIDALIREARRPVREGVEARCDACAVVAERVEFWAALAEDQGREVSLSLPAGRCPVRAGAADLEAALDALLGNVVAHTPDGAGLAVSLAPGPGGSWLLEIDDEGPGFADSDVLERGDSRAGSTGLGLDIARRTAVASGGDLTIGRSPSGGARVTMRLGPPTSAPEW
jgi:signal transduction histidine kinase